MDIFNEDFLTWDSNAIKVQHCCKYIRVYDVDMADISKIYVQI